MDNVLRQIPVSLEFSWKYHTGTVTFMFSNGVHVFFLPNQRSSNWPDCPTRIFTRDKDATVANRRKVWERSRAEQMGYLEPSCSHFLTFDLWFVCLCVCLLKCLVCVLLRASAWSYLSLPITCARTQTKTSSILSDLHLPPYTRRVCLLPLCTRFMSDVLSNTLVLWFHLKRTRVLCFFFVFFLY